MVWYESVLHMLSLYIYIYQYITLHTLDISYSDAGRACVTGRPVYRLTGKWQLKYHFG